MVIVRLMEKAIMLLHCHPDGYAKAKGAGTSDTKVETISKESDKSEKGDGACRRKRLDRFGTPTTNEKKFSIQILSKDSLLRSPEKGLRRITPARGPKPGIPEDEDFIDSYIFPPTTVVSRYYGPFNSLLMDGNMPSVNLPSGTSSTN
ncbi:unnamed protein product [Vicia faba]|uniref:Uncharacterized protein n=1 Tax=Vicia faba TaxID=3906 RepID=A0AAV0Z683_VICFA|nr:unnamed protein product [Vicia faba]